MHKDQQMVNAWESTVRKSQQQQTSGNRRRFFPPTVVAPADDESVTTASSYDGEESEDREKDDGEQPQYVERQLPNGDSYIGLWSGDVPHGVGKYLWADGCVYEGEWRHGKATGRGKFSWPSGASYEGEFKAGYMDGFGTFTGPSGDAYRGTWSMNLKHGHGKKYYANGDNYEGEWRSGLHEGHGRYSWRSGAEYVGQWRAGVIHGRGTLVWANGNRYDGSWENGSPRGNGNFRWADGSLYVGTWTEESTGIEQKGVYYPSPTATSPTTVRDPQDAFTADLKECRISQGEAVSVLLSQKLLSWSSSNASDGRARRRPSFDNAGAGAGVAAVRRAKSRTHTGAGTNENAGGEGFDRTSIGESDEDMTRGIVEGNAAVGRERMEDPTAVPGRSSEREMRTTSGTPPRGRWQPPRPAKKQGETISKGHKNYDLMLNLQLGIRHAVGKQGPTSLELKASAFDPKEKVWTRFPPEGSKHTPPHQSCDFRWKDYCPLVFRTLRRLFKVDAADYMISLCGNDALRELSSPGKSGSFFYLTQDDRYMIKTMKKAEVKVFLRMLPAYYKHVSAFESTLVTRFFGLHCVKLTGSSQKKVRFVIMGNLFCTDYSINRRFDLKGSSLGRTTSKPDAEIDEYTILKDLDLNFLFRLQRPWFQEFQRQVDKDCEFLEQERIMDYSLLVGVHFRSRDAQSHEFKGDTDSTRDVSNSRRYPAIRLGINMPARAERTLRRNDIETQLVGEPTGQIYEVILFFGIIDILQDYDISKKLEHAYKSFQYDPTSISAVDPRQYSRRFRDFIYKAFTEDN